MGSGNGKASGRRRTPGGGAQPKARIDRDKLSAAIRQLDSDRICFMLEDALQLLPESAIVRLATDFLDLKALRPDPETKGSLLAIVKAFEQASLRGDYREDFNVNSKNYMEKSKGTKKWIAECNRLLDRCVAKTKGGNPVELREAFEIIFALLRSIDEGRDDVIFLADEQGSWQVGVSWAEVLPAWFTCLAATAAPEDYARNVVEVVEEFEEYNREKHLAAARRAATPAQRKHLPRSRADKSARRGL